MSGDGAAEVAAIEAVRVALEAGVVFTPLLIELCDEFAATGMMSVAKLVAVVEEQLILKQGNEEATNGTV